MKKPICLFDSGIGGFTVLKKLLQKYPNETYLYFGDIANMPYGDRTKEEINKFAYKIITWFSKFNPKSVIMACNTSSSTLSSDLEKLSSEFGFPIYGIIESVCNEVAKSDREKVTVWATKRTVDTHVYKNTINKLNSNINVEEIACPKLVPMIEDFKFPSDKKQGILEEYLAKTSKDSDGLIWGCTHYPLIENELKKITEINTIDPADALINELDLDKTEQAKDIVKNVTIYTSAQKDKVKQFSKLFLCGDFEVKEISINNNLAGCN